MLLDRIRQTGDIKKIRPSQYDALAAEIRAYIIETVSHTGGHLASNLGVVELTMALHIVFNPPKDKIIWDVGHQSYTHKILTGRKDLFDTLRAHGGISGFPKRRESICDCFETGHSSTSISAGLGFAQARDLLGQKFNVISVIGDGSLTGGMAYEALNNASRLKTNYIIVLNDNTMSISENVGGISSFLAKLRTSETYNELKKDITSGITSIPKVGQNIYQHISNTKKSLKQTFVRGGMLFEDMDVTYLGPFDGHNVSQLIEVFNHAKKVQGPVVVHVLTRKGKGYAPAEAAPSKYHGVSPFNAAVGIDEIKSEDSYTDIFGRHLVLMGEENKKITAVTAAMAEGTGLSEFERIFPERFFDVGIAEQHAVTFAAGLASMGLIPFVAIYSSFLQRSYDQILHDVCIQDLHVVFSIDRAGLVGCDGETHQGIYDLSYLLSIPGLTVICPKNGWEMEAAMEFAAIYNHPVAIRYPKGSAWMGLSGYEMPFEKGRAEWIFREGGICLAAIGSMVATAFNVHERLHSVARECSLINLRFASPIDYEAIRKAAESHSLLVIMEENVYSGGVAEHILAWLEKNDIHIKSLTVTLPDKFIEHGSVSDLKSEYGLDENSIFEKIFSLIFQDDADETKN